MKEFRINELLGQLIILLFTLLSIIIIIRGLTIDSTYALGYPYWSIGQRYVYSFERVPVISRLTIIIIILFIFSIFLKRYKIEA